MGVIVHVKVVEVVMICRVRDVVLGVAFAILHSMLLLTIFGYLLMDPTLDLPKVLVVVAYVLMPALGWGALSSFNSVMKCTRERYYREYRHLAEKERRDFARKVKSFVRKSCN